MAGQGFSPQIVPLFRFKHLNLLLKIGMGRLLKRSAARFARLIIKKDNPRSNKGWKYIYRLDFIVVGPVQENPPVILAQAKGWKYIFQLNLTMMEPLAPSFRQPGVGFFHTKSTHRIFCVESGLSSFNKQSLGSFFFFCKYVITMKRASSLELAMKYDPLFFVWKN